MGIRKISAMIEWRRGLDGPSGLILLQRIMVLWSITGAKIIPETTVNQWGGTVAPWLALLPQRQGTGFHSRLGSLSVWSLHIVPVSAWVCSHSLKDMLVRWIGHAKFSLSVSKQAPECGDYGIFTITSLQCECKTTCDTNK